MDHLNPIAEKALRTHTSSANRNRQGFYRQTTRNQ
jgi:hypothetical protein